MNDDRATGALSDFAEVLSQVHDRDAVRRAIRAAGERWHDFDWLGEVKILGVPAERLVDVGPRRDELELASPTSELHVAMLQHLLEAPSTTLDLELDLGVSSEDVAKTLASLVGLKVVEPIDTAYRAAEPLDESW